jgi:hypothetical protein
MEPEAIFSQVLNHEVAEHILCLSDPKTPNSILSGSAELHISIRLVTEPPSAVPMSMNHFDRFHTILVPFQPVSFEEGQGQKQNPSLEFSPCLSSLIWILLRGRDGFGESGHGIANIEKVAI